MTEQANRVAALLRTTGAKLYPPGLRGVGETIRTVAPAGPPGDTRTLPPVGASIQVRMAPPTRTSRELVPNEVAARRFVTWVAQTYPRLYNAAEKRATGRTLAGLGADTAATTTASTGGVFSRLLDSITSLAPTYLEYKAQKDLLEVNMDRARQGLAPLDAAAYTPGVRLSVDPAQAQAAAQAAWDASRPWLIGGAALVGGLVLMNIMAKRRRRR